MRKGSRNRPIVFIAGPTGSGKSALAAELARRGRGVVINADALQVYRDLRILTARPSPEEEKEIPHRLYGMVPAWEAYSAGLWLSAARDAIEECWIEGLVPIVTGGTGLYFKVLEQGLVRLPPISPPIRQYWRERLRSNGAATLHAELALLDPTEACRLGPADGHRIARALEVFQATGRPLRAWQQEREDRSFLEQSRSLKLFISPPRQQLYSQIDSRFDCMLEAGALSEAAALLALKLDPSLPVMKAIGIQELKRVLSGEIALEEGCRIAKRNTRRYAKRQLTWARSNMIAWNRVEKQLTEYLEQVLINFISLRGQPDQGGPLGSPASQGN